MRLRVRTPACVQSEPRLPLWGPRAPALPAGLGEERSGADDSRSQEFASSRAAAEALGGAHRGVVYMGPAAPQANTDRRPKALGNAVFTAEGRGSSLPRRLQSTSAEAQLLPPRKDQGGRGRAPGHLPEAPSRASASEAGSAATPGGEGPSRRAPVRLLTLTLALSCSQEGVGEAQGAPLLAGPEAGLRASADGEPWGPM